LGEDGDIPAPLGFGQPTQKEVNLLMVLDQERVAAQLTHRASTGMNRGRIKAHQQTSKSQGIGSSIPDGRSYFFTGPK
jgi:hypothetical protein